MQTLNFSNIQTLAFAGGGNRCWWQAGLLTHLQAYGARLPASLVGTSAGAAIAASLLTGSTATALQACQRLYAANAQVFDWRGLTRFQLNFAHQTVYPAWLTAFVNEGNFKALQSASSRLLVAVTRPARGLAWRAAWRLALWPICWKKTVSQHPPGPAPVHGFETGIFRSTRLQNGKRSSNHTAGRSRCTAVHVRRSSARWVGF